jgi:hypothetical protein
MDGSTGQLCVSAVHGGGRSASLRLPCRMPLTLGRGSDSGCPKRTAQAVPEWVITEWRRAWMDSLRLTGTPSPKWIGGAIHNFIDFDHSTPAREGYRCARRSQGRAFGACLKAGSLDSTCARPVCLLCGRDGGKAMTRPNRGKRKVLSGKNNRGHYSPSRSSTLKRSRH